MSLSTLPVHATLLHPRTGMPLRAVGFRKNGRPIWPILGGDGTDDDANDDKKSDDDEKSTDDDKKSEDKSQSWEEVFAGKTPAEIKEALDNSRKWENRSKANKDKADQYDALAKFISGKDDEDETPDPEKLKGDLTAAQRDARETKVENRILRVAGQHGADGSRLVDSRSFMQDVIAKLDPTADDFGTKVAEEIKKAVDNDAYFAASTTTTRPAPTRQQGRPSEGGKRGGSVAEVIEQRRAARAAK